MGLGRRVRTCGAMEVKDTWLGRRVRTHRAKERGKDPQG